MNSLRVSSLSVATEGVSLVNNVTFELSQGEILAVIGSNGAGKTTLIETLVGENKTEHSDYKISGDITFCDQTMNKWKSTQKARHIAYLPQLSALSFPFTVEEVIHLGRIPHSTGVRVDREIIQEALGLLDITHLKTRFYTQLSGGEKQRVQLARVMSQIWREQDASERILILDEPTSSLDLGHQQQLMSVISAFAKQGVAVIIVAHDVNLVTQYADQILGLYRGEVVARGTPERVITPATMKALYQVDINVLAHPRTQKPIIV
jgi:iron complex transport system ATP-binding protein